MTLKLVFVLLYFWQNDFENCATGTDVANVSLYAEGSFLRSMAYYAFFIEGIEVAWTDRSWCKMRKKQKPAKCLPKTQTNEQCLFNFTVSVEFSCKYVSDNIFFKNNLYNIVECEGFLSPRHRLLKSCIRLCLHQAVNLCLYHIELLVIWEEAPHLNDISLRKLL